MLFSDSKEYHISSPMLDAGSWPSSCWLGYYIPPSDTGYWQCCWLPTILDPNTLLLKTQKSRAGITWRLPLYLLAFLVIHTAIQAAKGGKSQVLLRSEVHQLTLMIRGLLWDCLPLTSETTLLTSYQHDRPIMSRKQGHHQWTCQRRWGEAQEASTLSKVLQVIGMLR